MSPIKTIVRSVAILLVAIVLAGFNFSSYANAVTRGDINSLMNNTPFFDPNDNTQLACSITPVTASNSSIGTTATAVPVSASNLDYAGRTVLSEAQLSQIQQNQPVYQQAAQQAGIPWQMLAVVHLREHGLKVSNPSNGQGIYQFVNQQGGPYPAGPVSQDEFLRQSILAAQFLKSKAGANYSTNQNLTTNADTSTIKDTFYSYNGRASAYADQAASLGFDRGTQGFEGSPYVMNKADAKRDPASNPSGWGQIKTDNGGLVYPANNDYGAFVEYAALTGVAIGSACTGQGSVNCSGPGAQGDLSEVRKKVVCLAQHEYSLWQSKQLQPGLAGYGKYSQNHDENWCADFASWVYDQAGYPLQPDPNWRVPGVIGIQAIGQKEQNFHWHPAGSYTPKPGDFVIHGGDHVNLVSGVSGNKLTLLGGNQDAPPGQYPNGSSVTQYMVNGFSGVNGITGYVSPD